MRDAIAFVLGNFTLTFFVLGLVAAAIALWHARPPRTSAVIVEALFSYFLLFSIAIANFYNFVLHVFFGKTAAAFIGWQDSPFQAEVGFASLGFAVLGLLAFKGSFDLRLAAIVGPAFFLWGGGWARLPDDHRPQFCPRQCRGHFLQRYLGSHRGLHISLAAAAHGPMGCRPLPRRLKGQKLRARALHFIRRDDRTKREQEGLAPDRVATVEKGDGAGTERRLSPGLGVRVADNGATGEQSWPVA